VLRQQAVVRVAASSLAAAVAVAAIAAKTVAVPPAGLRAKLAVVARLPVAAVLLVAASSPVAAETAASVARGQAPVARLAVSLAARVPVMAVQVREQMSEPVATAFARRMLTRPRALSARWRCARNGA